MSMSRSFHFGLGDVNVVIQPVREGLHGPYADAHLQPIFCDCTDCTSGGRRRWLSTLQFSPKHCCQTSHSCPITVKILLSWIFDRHSLQTQQRCLVSLLPVVRSKRMASSPRSPPVYDRGLTRTVNCTIIKPCAHPRNRSCWRTFNAESMSEP